MGLINKTIDVLILQKLYLIGHSLSSSSIYHATNSSTNLTILLDWGGGVGRALGAGQ